MRQRPRSGWLVFNGKKEILLFKLDFKSGHFAGRPFWATPGGGVEAGESHEEAACRELWEELNIKREDPGPVLERLELEISLPNGERAWADERFYVHHTDSVEITMTHWTDYEREIMTVHKWWSRTELSNTTETIYPDHIVELYDRALAGD